jgi:protein tyrosine kinase modulator
VRRGTRPAPQNAQLAIAESHIAALRVRAAEYESRYATMKAAWDRMPQLEAEFAQLTREHEAGKLNYQKLLERRESAQISQNMDQRRGMEFRVVDPPRVPLEPSWPNRLALLSVVLLAGVGGGIALAVLLSQIRPTFTDRRTLREVTGMTILGSVSAIWTDKERARQKRNLFAWTGAYAGLVTVYGGIVAVLMLATGGAP